MLVQEVCRPAEDLGPSKAQEYRRLAGRGRGSSKNPSASALAQRRYHQRQKVRLPYPSSLMRCDQIAPMRNAAPQLSIAAGILAGGTFRLDFFMQAKKMDSERQLYDLSQKMEELMQEKKEVELKNKILLKDLMTWQDHLEELWGREVRCKLLIPSRMSAPTAGHVSSCSPCFSQPWMASQMTVC